MSIKLIANVKNPPIGALAAVYLINSSTPVEIVWSNETALLYPNGNRFVCHSNVEVLRALARAAPAYTPNLYGETAIERTQIDHWLSFALTFEDDMSLLDKSIAPVTFLVGNKLTIADLALFSEIHTNYMKLTAKGIPQNVQRWYDLLAFQPSIQKALNSLPAESFTETKSGSPAECEETPKASGERKREGKFVVLPGAEMGKVVVRFPPEASGYLHIGHAKAALLNQYYALAFDGKLIMRFDDTNPAKETVEFENVILGDLELLQIKPDLFTHTSNYFDIMLDYCEQLIKSGKAYVDDTPPEQMKLEREQKIESVNRLNDAEKNMSMWQEMKKGTEMGQKYCVRAKIDMSSANGCMRDPTIYRCKNEPHPRTGTKYKVYPTYDFACPIVDAIENVTHTLRTMEYHDRDDQFYWFIDALNLRKPYIWEYSRLNMTNTVLSKRKLAWFVEQGLVDGWDDPRFPTVRGILRRGMTVEGLKEFIIAQGSSKSVVFMNWDKIWAFNKKVIDPIAPRYTALRYDNRVLVNVSGAATETIEVPVHPKNASLGKKTVKLGPRIYIDYTDAETLREGENTTFINWGNLLIQKINKDTSSGKIISVDASLNLDNKDFKKTLKLTWLAVEDDPLEYPPTYCVYFDHIISKPVLGKDEDFKQYIGHKTREELKMLGDPELKKCKKGDIIQLQRQGFFKVDNAYAPASGFSNAVSPVILFHIPDGHTKDMPSGALKMNSNTLNNAENNSVHRSTTTTSTNVEDLDKEIIKQGKFVRDLKERKSPKQEIDIAVKQLLSLKADYKSVTGCEWKPQSQPQQSIKTPVGSNNNKIVEKVNIENGLKKPDHLDDGQPNDGKINEILTRISSQGDKVRELKSNKAEKELIDVEVKALLKLKADYKKLTGADWKPGLTPKVQIKQENSPEPPSASTIGKLLEKISSQGNKIRQLKAAKVDKSNIDAEVKLLLALKADFKSLTGQEWKPDINPLTIIKSISPEPIKIDLTVNSDTTSESEKAKLWRKIKTQGDYVRKLKSEKQPKVIIEAEVQSLLFLKSEYKNIFGQEWNPQEKIEPSTAVRDEESEGYTPISEKDQLIKEIYERDEKIQIDKSNNASEEQVQDDMKRLLALKARYKQVTGMDFPVKARTASACSKASLDVEKKQLHKTEKSTKKEKSPKVAPKKECATAAGGGGALKKQTRLGLEATKENNLPEWYSQIITKAELIEYYDVSGCYILRPWSFAVWKAIKNWFDAKITEMGVKECYFPIFVSRSALEREKDHVADFAPEVAWVTKSGESDLAEPIAVRPTSETVMYPAYAKWIQSYRDLPLRLNQWSNVVRWEFKHPQPFLRTREFLWQEGHTAFASQSDADKEVLDILDLYAKIYTDLLAIPVVKGRKTEKEKFAGASYTTTVEAFVSASGRAIQGATSHHLGQNFSKMFEIVYEDPETQQKQYVFQNSWGITTRTIGVMVMVHADNQGIILPPHVACIQAIIVPCGITVNTNDVEREELLNACKKLEDKLRSYGVRCEGDYRDNYSPGWKFNHWELKGVPLRIELGPKDIKANQIVAVRRDTGEKLALTLDNVESNITDLLENVHESLFAKASADLKSHTKIVKDWSEFCKVLDQKNILLSPFCGEISCEDKIKADSARDEDAEPGAPSMGAKSLCIPFDQPAAITTTDKCIHPGCSLKPKYYTLFGRSY